MLAENAFITYNVLMSIPKLYNKIKGNLAIDKTTIMYLLIVIGVGVSAFGLGRLSVDVNSKNDKITSRQDGYDVAGKEYNREYIREELNKENLQLLSSSINNKESNLSTAKKNYVASKNGKLYYSLGCPGIKRIKVTNQVWFATSSDAEKAGFTKSSSCK